MDGNKAEEILRAEYIARKESTRHSCSAMKQSHLPWLLSDSNEDADGTWRDRRTWNPEHLTENVNSSHMYPNLAHLETGLDEGKDRPLQNCEIQFTLCLLQLCLYSSVCVLSFLLCIQRCLLQDGQVEGKYQNLLLIKIHFPSGLLISPVYAKKNN